MSAPLYLVRAPISLSKLAIYAGDRGWTKRRGRDGRESDASFDEGRALHHVLDEAFGPNALKPFRLMAPRGRDRGAIYAYSNRPKAELLADLQATAAPEFVDAGIFALDRLDEKLMPTAWSVGRRIGFDVRVRPVVRIHSALPNPRAGQKAYAPQSEVDAYIAEAQRQHPDTAPRRIDGALSPSGMSIAGRDRQAVYRDWLANRLEGVAEIDPEKTTMVAFQRSRVARAGRSVEGPDATFHGELTITNPDAFMAVLARGVGRHRSFGFGMLLLRPLQRR